MKLIPITDKNNRVHYINVNHITRVYEHRDEKITIMFSDGGDIVTKITYQEFLDLLS